MAKYSTGEKTREALIEATGELASEMGFAKISTREIARRAGENAGSIHYHFKSKEGLFEAVLLKATEAYRKNPLAETLSVYEKELDRPAVQARALKEAIHWTIDKVLLKSNHRWHCKVTSSVLRNTGWLRDMLFKEALDPTTEAFTKLLQRIDPSLTFTDAFCEVMTICAPIYIYADHKDNLYEKLGVDFKEEKYLKKIEESIITRTLLYFKLPIDDEGKEGC